MEWMVTNDGKYRIESLSAATFSGALRVIRDSFCLDESVSIGTEVNINPKAIEELLELCADAALDGVSLVAVEIATGEVAAVSFNKIQGIIISNVDVGTTNVKWRACLKNCLQSANIVNASDVTEKPFFEIFAEERCTQASSRSLIQFMADVDGRCNLFEKYGVDCSLEIMFLGTLREHRRQKLATILSKISIGLARKIRDGPVADINVEDLGLKYAHLVKRKPLNTYPKICQAIWTAEGSRKVGKALDFTVHLTVPFTEYTFNGKTYTERIGDEAAFCEVAALAL